MLSVELIAKPDINSIKLMSDAARGCYEPEQPKDDKIMDLEGRVFNVGHHTVMQHPGFTFFIEGIAIGDITMGLHLYNPYYVSGQRSGRFCFGMFSDPDTLTQVMDYIRDIYAINSENLLRKIKDYVKFGMELFGSNLDNATTIASEFIQTERPNAPQKYVDQNAKKFAQEQLRMFIPVILPTGDTFSINIYTIAAMYRTAWSPVMLKLTELMAKEITDLYPELDYMFSRQTSRDDYTLSMPSFTELQTSPYAELLSMDNLDCAVWPNYQEMFPFDTLQFNPVFMNNNLIDIESSVLISLATMGQDQRHRSIRRDPFQFTGDIYCPPIIYQLGIGHKLIELTEMWHSLEPDVDTHLLASLAPYGAMVQYKKKGNLNAILHESGKRLCWCAQEEISNTACLLRGNISQHSNCRDELLSVLSPPCFESGKCGEGVRYCGRDLKVDRKNFFPRRKV